MSPRAAQDSDGAATRCLCHAVHLQDSLRRFVLDHLIEHGVQAVCPATGIDLVAVARHAAAADRRRQRAEKILVAIRVALFLTICGGTGLIALNFRGRATGLTAPLITLCLAGTLVISAWLTLFWQIRAGMLSALQAWKGPRPRGQFPPLDRELEDLLDGVPNGNVIVYADGQGDPFVGSGKRLDHWNIGPIDLIGEEIDEKGGRKKPRRFDAAEVHTYLVEHMPRRGFTELKASERLYVRGDYVKHIRDLLPDPRSHPALTVREQELALYIYNPTMFARTYVCMEQIVSDDRLVVSMFVRARLDHELLSLESNIFTLPSVSQAFRPTTGFVTDGRRGIDREAFTTASRAALPALFGHSHTAGREIFRRKRRSPEEVLRDIDKGYLHDYGAVTSLREAVSFGRGQYNDTADVIDCAKRMRRRLIDTVEEFLKEHDVDTSEFRNQAQIINNTTISYEIGAVTGSYNIVGSHGQINGAGGKDERK